jgi:hypothetical protein
MAVQPFIGPWPPFHFLDPVHSQQDSLDGGSDRRNAATCTQNNTNRINAHNTDIHALSGIRTYDLSVRMNESCSCLRPRPRCDRLRMPLGLWEPVRVYLCCSELFCFLVLACVLALPAGCIVEHYSK